MSHSHFDRERDVALAAVREAAILCREVQQTIKQLALSKEDRSPVTVADFGSQALICRTLEQAFPGDPVVAEEESSELRRHENEELRSQIVRFVSERCGEADIDSICGWIDRGHAAGGAVGRFWTLDPIDGTKGFLRGGQYAVALALIVDGRVEVAAMACPNLPIHAQDESAGLGTIFTAIRGQGAEVRPLDGDGAATPIRVSDRTDPQTIRFCESVESGHSSHDTAAIVASQLGIKTPPVRLDSQAKYATVSRGEADVYLRFPTRSSYNEKIWDHASGVLILEEAGGTVTDLSGRPLDFTRGRELSENRGIVATNSALHERVLEVIAATLQG